MNEQLKGKLKFHLVEEKSGAKIKVIGIGGGGGNAVNRMIETGIEGAQLPAKLFLHPVPQQQPRHQERQRRAYAAGK